MYLYIHQLSFPNLPFYNGKKIILSATKFYQCSKALDQGKLHQSGNTQAYKMEDISLLQVQISNPEKNPI